MRFENVQGLGEGVLIGDPKEPTGHGTGPLGSPRAHAWEGNLREPKGPRSKFESVKADYVRLLAVSQIDQVQKPSSCKARKSIWEFSNLFDPHEVFKTVLMVIVPILFIS